jgi:Family of unknown function (DUF6328)
VPSRSPPSAANGSIGLPVFSTARSFSARPRIRVFQGTRGQDTGFHNSFVVRASTGKMSSELDKKLKTALDETRLLILGAQVLLGFQFQAFFQDGFSELSQRSRYLSLFGLLSIVLAVTFLIVPSMQHRLVEQGRSSTRLIGVTSFYAGTTYAERVRLRAKGARPSHRSTFRRCARTNRWPRPWHLVRHSLVRFGISD